jgi:hypothetical protein
MILAKMDEIYSNAAIYGSVVSFVKTSLNIYDLNHVNKPNTKIEDRSKKKGREGPNNLERQIHHPVDLD